MIVNSGHLLILDLVDFPFKYAMPGPKIFSASNKSSTVIGQFFIMLLLIIPLNDLIVGAPILWYSFLAAFARSYYFVEGFLQFSPIVSTIFILSFSLRYPSGNS